MLRTLGRLASRAASLFRGGYTQEIYSALSGLGGAVSVAGVKVNRKEALKLAAFLRGVTLIANYVGKTPCHVWADRTKDHTHPAHQLVRWWARKYRTSAFEFRRVLTCHALVAGNGYGYISRDPHTMQPLETRILDPADTWPIIRNGELLYQTRLQGRQSPLDLNAWDVIHIRGLGWDGLSGLDTITYGGQVLGLGLAQQNFASRYMEKGGAPSVVIEVEGTIDDDVYNKRRDEWRAAIQNHEALLADGGAKVKPWNLTAEQMQLLGAREFTLVEIANLLNINASKLNAKTNVSYKSLEEDNRAFRDDTLDPWFCQFELEYRKLLTEAEQDRESRHLEFVREALNRFSLKDRADYLVKAVGGPWMTPNQAADVSNLPAHPDGDKLYPPPGTPKPDAAEPDTAPADDRSGPAPRESAELAARADALADVFGRMCRRLARQTERAASKPDAVQTFIDELQARNASQITEALQPVAAVCGLPAEACSRLATELVTDLAADLLTVVNSPDAAAGITAAAARFEHRGPAYALAALDCLTA